MSVRVHFDLPVVCINYYGRSGSTLLQGLLDGHPQIMSAPPHSLCNLYRFTTAINTTQPAISVEKLVMKVLQNFPYIFAETDQTPMLRAAAKLSKIGVPQVQFANVLQKILKQASPRHAEPGVLFRAIHYAYDVCLGRDVNQCKLIVWQKHEPFISENDKAKFVSEMQNARFLVPVRRPEVTFNSHYDYKNFQHDRVSRRRSINILLDLLNASGRVNKDLLPLSFAVRFEDMHGNPEGATRAIADWLGIDWQPSMLEPTVDGQEQLFPKGEGVVRGLNTNIEKTQKAKHFSLLDRLLLEAVNHKAYDQWRYPTVLGSTTLKNILARILIHLPLRIEWMELKRDFRNSEKMTDAIRNAADRRRQVKEALANLKMVNDQVGDIRILPLIY